MGHEENELIIPRYTGVLEKNAFEPMQEYLNLFFLGHEMLTQPIDSLPKAPSCTLALEGGYLFRRVCGWFLKFLSLLLLCH
jgi:hypothetical protein